MDRCYKYPALHIACYILNWCTVVVNPTVYFFRNEKYKVSFFIKERQYTQIHVTLHAKIEKMPDSCLETFSDQKCHFSWFQKALFWKLKYVFLRNRNAHITFVENFQLKIIFFLKLEILIYSSYLISEEAFKGTVVNRTFPSFYTLLKIHVNYSNFLNDKRN